MQNVNSTQPVTPPPVPSASTTSTSATSQTAQASKTQFLQLLVAQLKGQNPLDPKDGAEFVSQLAQFSSLEELINIRSALDTLVKASTTASKPSETSSPFKQT